MTTLTFKKLSEAYGHVISDIGVLEEVSDYFAYRPQGYQFMPLYKKGIWDGYVREFTVRKPVLRIGLRATLQRFCDERNYEFIEENFEPPDDFSIDEAKAFVKSLKITSPRGDLIEPRDYQIEAFAKAVSRGRGVFLSPTASGKSLILYLIARFLIDNDETKRLLITVPTINLVDQMADDFLSYSKLDGWIHAKEITRLGGGRSTPGKSRITVSTWQTLIKFDKEWFHQFDTIFGDEVHTNKAASLSTIMDNALNARRRVGVTGTLDDSVVHKTIIVGHFGEVHTVTTTKALMESGAVSQLSILGIRLKYCEEDRLLVRSMTYEEELAFILSHEDRDNKLVSMARGFNGNLLVLFNRIEHGKRVFSKLTHGLKGRNVYYISGETEPELRDRIRKKIDKEKDCVVVASLGTFSTGIDAPELHGAVFAHPFKAKIKALQSIGRILRKSRDGRPAQLLDLIDDLAYKRRNNYAMTHAVERFKIYSDQGFDVATASISMRPKGTTT